MNMTQETTIPVKAIDARKLMLKGTMTNKTMLRMMKGNRGGNILLVDGFRYHLNRTRKDVAYWRCWREDCRIYVKTKSLASGEPQDVLGDDLPIHKHEREDDIIERAVQRQPVVSELREHPEKTTRVAYNDVLKDIPTKHRAAFHSLEPTLNRVRRSVLLSGQSTVLKRKRQTQSEEKLPLKNIVRMIEGNRGGKILLAHGFRYRLNKTRKDVAYWRCWRKDCRLCVRTKSLASGEPQDVLGDVLPIHKHEREDDIIEQPIQKQAVVKELREHPEKTTRAAYNDVLKDISTKQRMAFPTLEPTPNRVRRSVLLSKQSTVLKRKRQTQSEERLPLRSCVKRREGMRQEKTIPEQQDRPRHLSPEKSLTNKKVVRMIKGTRGGKILLADGFRYRHNKTCEDVAYWRCWRANCQLYIKTKSLAFGEPQDVLGDVLPIHKHKREDDIIERAIESQAVVGELREHPEKTTRVAYNDVLKDIPTKHRASFHTLEPTLSRVRRSVSLSEQSTVLKQRRQTQSEERFPLKNCVRRREGMRRGKTNPDQEKQPRHFPPDKAITNKKIVRIIEGNRGGKILLADGFRYRLNKTKKDVAYWRCWRANCQFYVKTKSLAYGEPQDVLGDVFPLHKHEREDDVIERAIGSRAVVGELREHPEKTTRVAYNDVLKDIPTKQQTAFHTLEPTLNRVRRSVRLSEQSTVLKRRRQTQSEELPLKNCAKRKGEVMKQEKTNPDQEDQPRHLSPEKAITNKKIVGMMEGNRGGKILLVDGFRYHLNRTRKDVAYWRCWRADCPLYVKTKSSAFEEPQDILGDDLPIHKHEREADIIDRALQRQAVVSEVKTHPENTVRASYNHALKAIPVKDRVAFLSLESPLNRARRSALQLKNTPDAAEPRLRRPTAPRENIILTNAGVGGEVDSAGGEGIESESKKRRVQNETGCEQGQLDDTHQTAAAPFSISISVTDYQLSESYLIVQEDIKPEPSDTDTISREAKNSCDCMEGVASTKRSRQTTEKQATENKYNCIDCRCSTKNYHGDLANHASAPAKETKIKKYECTTCQYSTHFKDSLAAHMRCHTGEMPNHCELCSYKATRPHVLRNHMKMKHSEISQTAQSMDKDYKKEMRKGFSMPTRNRGSEM